MPHNLITRARRETIPVAVVAPASVAAWLRKLPKAQRDWLTQSGFTGKKGTHALLPGTRGGVQRAVFVADKESDLWAWSGLAAALPKASYRLEGRLAKALANAAALGWGLAAYEFTKYRKAKLDRPELVWPANTDRAAVRHTLDATALVRDLINTPAEDMGQIGRAHV